MYHFVYNFKELPRDYIPTMKELNRFTSQCVLSDGCMYRCVKHSPQKDPTKDHVLNMNRKKSIAK